MDHSRFVGDSWLRVTLNMPLSFALITNVAKPCEPTCRSMPFSARSAEKYSPSMTPWAVVGPQVITQLVGSKRAMRLLERQHDVDRDNGVDGTPEGTGEDEARKVAVLEIGLWDRVEVRRCDRTRGAEDTLAEREVANTAQRAGHLGHPRRVLGDDLATDQHAKERLLRLVRQPVGVAADVDELVHVAEHRP